MYLIHLKLLAYHGTVLKEDKYLPHIYYQWCCGEKFYHLTNMRYGHMSIGHRICIFMEPSVSSFLDASVVDEGTEPKEDMEGEEDEPSD